MYFGAPVWPMRWVIPYNDTIRRIAQLGFKGVELIGWDIDSFDRFYTPQSIKELRELIAGEGLTLTNFNCTPENICNPDMALRTQARDIYKRAIYTAAELGSKHLTSVAPYPFGMNDKYVFFQELPIHQEWTVDADLDLDFSGNYELYAEELRTACALAKESGLKLLIEPHPYRWVNSSQSMLRLVEKVDMDNLGFNFDPSHLFPAGDMPQIAVYLVKDRLWHTHFSDNDSFTNAHWRPGKGKIDWFAILKALKYIGYDSVISLELENVPGAANAKSIDCTPRMEQELLLSMEYIREICKQLDITIA